MTTEIIQNQNSKLVLKTVIVLVLIKCIYILLEYFYNINIFNTASSIKLFNEGIVNQLNENGHRISSIGITLILAPIFYIFIKNIKGVTKTVLYVVIPIIIYFSAYYSLNKIVDVIVEQNKEKRYEAYYLNMFKIGLLHNYFEYDSFIDNEKIKNDTLSEEDKLLFLNTFLLLNAREDFIETLKQKGEPSFANIYIDQHRSVFDDKYNKYLEFDKEVQSKFKEFNDAKVQLSATLKDMESKYSDSQIQKDFQQMEKEIDSSYSSYSSKSNSAKNKIYSRDEIEDIYKDLNRYFNNRGKAQAEQTYRKKMNENFGKYINPDRWLGDDGKLSRYKIKEVISEESNLNSNVSSKDNFKSSSKVKEKIIAKLKAKGLKNISDNVDYSKYSNFSTLIKNNIELNKKEVIDKFYKELNKKIGKNDLTLQMGWNEFLSSSFLKEIIKDKLDVSKNEDISKIVKVLNSENKEESFKNNIFVPKLKEDNQINKYLFTKEVFNSDENAIKAGDNAIKLLYVPIFALIVSIISLLLNLISVISIILEKLFNLNFIKKSIINIGLIFIAIVLPLMSNISILNNNIIKTVITNNDLSMYLNFLNWICYYEKLLNY